VRLRPVQGSARRSGECAHPARAARPSGDGRSRSLRAPDTPLEWTSGALSRAGGTSQVRTVVLQGNSPRNPVCKHADLLGARPPSPVTPPWTGRLKEPVRARPKDLGASLPAWPLWPTSRAAHARRRRVSGVVAAEQPLAPWMTVSGDASVLPLGPSVASRMTWLRKGGPGLCVGEGQ
jgi:hypothetical protein